MKQTGKLSNVAPGEPAVNGAICESSRHADGPSRPNGRGPPILGVIIEEVRVWAFSCPLSIVQRPDARPGAQTGDTCHAGGSPLSENCPKRSQRRGSVRA